MVSSAMPSRVVEICASTMLAPAPVQAPATSASRRGWFGASSVISVTPRKASVAIWVDERLALRLGVADELGVLGDDVEIGPQPIRRVMPVDEALEIVLRPVGQPLAQRILRTGHALAAAQGRMAAAEQRLGLEIERAQQAGPSSRSTRPAPRRGYRPRSAAEEASSRSRLCTSAAKSRMRLRIVQVAALREQAHRQDDARPARPRSRSPTALSPKRGPSSRAMRAPAIEWSSSRPLAMSCSSAAT